MVQRIATPVRSVNSGTGGDSRRWQHRAWSLLAAAFVVVACGPQVDNARVTARPDTLVAGDPLGPYDGVVLDAETERPVAGAVIAASWAFERGVGLVGPATAREVVTETGLDGRYKIPALRDLPRGPSMRLSRFTMIVYKRGYVGWRSDQRFPTGEPRRDFSQRANRVRLERWQDGYRHHRHLAFLGGGQAIKSAVAWEVQPAALELDGGGRGTTAGAIVTVPGATTRPGPFDATRFLSEEDVRGVTGYAGEFEVGRLPDLPRTEFYDSRHFKAKGKPESHDVGLRIWKLGQAGAEQQYRKLQSELPGATSTDEIGDAALRAKAGEVLGLAFLAREPGVVVSLTCGTSQCTEPAMLLKLAKLVESHLADLNATPASSAVPAPEKKQP